MKNHGLNERAYLEPPERVGSLVVSVEELAGFGGSIEHILSRYALCLTDVTNLRNNTHIIIKIYNNIY